MNKKIEDFVTVSVRIRPILNEDQVSTCLQVINKKPPVLFVLDKAQSYNFDNIFTDKIKQKDVYNDTVKPLVGNVKNGYNCTVFAYGQTGTGKTYTMGTNPDIMNEDELGLISRTLEDFFCTISEDEEIKISISFIEIYNEKVFDLLAQNKIPLSVKGFNVHGFEKVRVYSTSDALLLLKIGGQNRHTGETKQNLKSSRSHAIFTIHYHMRNSETEAAAKLNLVDLAGSESVRKTGNQGSSFHEGININKGLLSLGQVMTALSTNSSHIPYRQSVITTILQDSLNKKNFVSLIACVSSNPEDLGETLHTLEFSQRVKKMRNKPEINQFIVQYKKDNPTLFPNSVSRGVTPKRPTLDTFETPFKKPKNYLPIIQEPMASINNSSFESQRSIFSTNVSSITNDNFQQNLSPVLKKYMSEMEQSLMSKLEDVIQNTLKKPVTRSSFRENKENIGTPSFSWDKVAKVVRSEILQFTAQVSRATSSPIEKGSPDLIFQNSGEKTQILKPKLLTYESCSSSPVSFEEATNERNETDNIFKMPAPKIKKKALKNPVRRSSVRLQMKKNRSPLQTEDTNRRRSVRLQNKKGTTSSSTEDNILKPTNTNRRSKEMSIEMNSPCLNCLHPKIASLKKSKPQDSPVTFRTKQVLHILNVGNLKEIEKLHTIGAKTAEKILFYRQMKGHFKSVSDLSSMPYWTKNKYKKFLAENFLRDESE